MKLYLENKKTGELEHVGDGSVEDCREAIQLVKSNESILATCYAAPDKYKEDELIRSK